MAKVQRRVIAKGDLHEFACALRRDGSSPAAEFLDALKRGEWEPDADAAGLPDDEQVRDYHLFIAWIEHWSQHGEPPSPHVTNYLTDGIWELKRGSKRLTFYDTDGRGNYTRKARIDDPRMSPARESDCWFIPNMDEEVRLGHAFPKVGQRTPHFDLNEATKVRSEDLQHDSFNWTHDAD